MTRPGQRKMPTLSNISSKAIRGASLLGIAALVGWIGPAGYAKNTRRDKDMIIDQTKLSLAVDLSLRVKKDEPILARLQFSNRSSRPYELLSWLIFPGGRIDSKNYFGVNVDGRPARYIGIMKKRRNPTAADYIAVKPGETLTSVVSLSDAYFINQPGILTVVYSAINPALVEGVPGDRLFSNTVSVHLD